MKKALVFGTGNNFIYSCATIENEYDIVGLADNSDAKQGQTYFGYKVDRFENYPKDYYDFIILTPNDSDEIRDQLISEGVDSKKIINLGEALSPMNSDSSLRLAVILYGGMGDYLIAKNWLYLLNAKYSIAREEICLFCKENDIGTISNIFSDCDWISCKKPISLEKSSLVHNEYDLIFRFSIFPYLQQMNDEKIYRKNRDLYEYADGVRKFGLENYNPSFFASPAFYRTVDKIFSMYPERKYHTQFDVLGNLKASNDYLCEIPVADGEAYLDSLGLKKKAFITIDTGLNQEYVSKPNTRAWKHENWDKLGKLIKKSYPGIKVVQMGLAVDGYEEIYADINLNGKTDLEQAKILLKESLLHIDYEGGLIHLRHVLRGGCSIVLMGPTSEKFHSYPENITVQTEACDVTCEWKGQDWLTHCQKRYEYPKCMESIAPEMVMYYVREFFKGINNGDEKNK